MEEGAIGARVKALRTGQGWSMRELADAAGVSQPFVSKLEAGLVAPSIPTLYALANALGASPGDLLPVPSAAPAADLHLRLNDATVAPTVRVVSGGAGSRSQVYLFELAAGQGDPDFPAHPGQDLLVVLDGTVLSSEAGRVDVRVAAGGSRSVDTSVVHGVRASADGPARFLLVCSDPPAA